MENSRLAYDKDIPKKENSKIVKNEVDIRRKFKI